MKKGERICQPPSEWLVFLQFLNQGVDGRGGGRRSVFSLNVLNWTWSSCVPCWALHFSLFHFVHAHVDAPARLCKRARLSRSCCTRECHWINNDASSGTMRGSTLRSRVAAWTRRSDLSPFHLVGRRGVLRGLLFSQRVPLFSVFCFSYGRAFTRLQRFSEIFCSVFFYLFSLGSITRSIVDSPSFWHWKRAMVSLVAPKNHSGNLSWPHLICTSIGSGFLDIAGVLIQSPADMR